MFLGVHVGWLANHDLVAYELVPYKLVTYRVPISHGSYLFARCGGSPQPPHRVLL